MFWLFFGSGFVVGSLEVLLFVWRVLKVCFDMVLGRVLWFYRGEVLLFVRLVGLCYVWEEYVGRVCG